MKKTITYFFSISFVILLLSGCGLSVKDAPGEIQNIPSNASNQVEELSKECEENNGAWLAEFKECEYVAKEWCDEKVGQFNECGSACRHQVEEEGEAMICTMQCVPFCQLATKEDSVEKGEEKLSQEIAEALVSELWGNCESTDCGEMTVSILNLDGVVSIEAIFEGIKDDSVSAQRKIVDVQHVNEDWEVVSEAIEEVRCQEGRGHSDFSNLLCN